MSDDLERMLREGAALAAEATRTAPVPDPPQAPPRRPVGMVVAGLVAAAALVGGLIVVTRHDDRRTISPVTPGIDTVSSNDGGVAVPVTDPSPSSPTTNPSSPGPMTSPTTSPATSPATTSTVLSPFDGSGTPVAGTPIADGAQQGLPAALGVLPAGYRVALANDGASSGGSGDVTWAATFIHQPVLDGELVDYVQVQINAIHDNDPYVGFPGLAQQPDATIGPFVGRWYDFQGTAGYSTFVSVLDAQRLMLVSGRASRAVIAQVVAGIQLPAGDPGRADATVLPDGYALLDEGPGFEPSAATEYDLLYVKGQAWATAIDVRTFIEPARPALMDAIGPQAPRIVDIDGYQGVYALGRLTIDITDHYQVQITYGGPMGPMNDPELEPVVALARSLIAIDSEQFAQYRAGAATAPFSPTDGDCTSYLSIANPRSSGANLLPDGTFTVPTPATITVDVSARQPLGRIEFLLPVDGELVMLASLPSLDGDATVDVTWDGMVGGHPAPADTYANLVISADPVDPSVPDACTNPVGSSRSGTDGLVYLSFGAAFVVS